MVGVGVLTAALAIYALNVEPDWVEVTTHTVGAGRADRLPGPIRIVQISDLHLRRFGDREVRLTQTIRNLKPGAIVFTGDIIDRAENLALLESFLAALGPTPRVAVIGNWEYWSTVDLQRLRSIYEATPNSSLLVNQRVALTLNGREFEFVGLDDFTAGKPDARLLRSHGWGLIDARTRLPVNPPALITDEMLEMTDWELQDLAVQVVREQIEKEGHQLMSWNGDPRIDPSVWFVGSSGGPEWVLVRAVRHPEKEATEPENKSELRSHFGKMGFPGHFASVAVASADDPFDPGAKSNGNYVPLFRGVGMRIRYEGLRSF